MFKRTLMALISMIILQGCQSTPRTVYKPTALGEVFRAGQVEGLESSIGAAMGMPDSYDRVPHTCSSMPEYNLQGYYVGTTVRCW